MSSMPPAHDAHHEPSQQPHLPSSQPARTRPFRSGLAYWAFLLLCMTVWIFADVTGNVAFASAATTVHFATHLSVPGATNTLQQFLKQGNHYKSFDGLHVAPGSQPA